MLGEQGLCLGQLLLCDPAKGDLGYACAPLAFSVARYARLAKRVLMRVLGIAQNRRLPRSSEGRFEGEYAANRCGKGAYSSFSRGMPGSNRPFFCSKRPDLEPHGFVVFT